MKTGRYTNWHKFNYKEKELYVALQHTEKPFKVLYPSASVAVLLDSGLYRVLFSKFKTKKSVELKTVPENRKLDNKFEEIVFKNSQISVWDKA